MCSLLFTQFHFVGLFALKVCEFIHSFFHSSHLISFVHPAVLFRVIPLNLMKWCFTCNRLFTREKKRTHIHIHTHTALYTNALIETVVSLFDFILSQMFTAGGLVAFQLKIWCLSCQPVTTQILSMDGFEPIKLMLCPWLRSIHFSFVLILSLACYVATSSAKSLAVSSFTHGNIFIPTNDISIAHLHSYTV